MYNTNELPIGLYFCGAKFCPPLVVLFILRRHPFASTRVAAVVSK
jgi:hypothetical protein